MMNFSSRFFEPPTNSALVTTKGGNSNPAFAFDNSASQSSYSTGGDQPYVMVPYALFQEMSGGQASSFPVMPYDQSQGHGGSMQFMGAGQDASATNMPSVSGTLNFSGTTGNKYVLQGNFYNPIFMTDGSSGQQQQHYPTNDQQQYYAPPPQYSMPQEPSLPQQPSNYCPPQQQQPQHSGDYGQPPIMMMPYIMCQYNPPGNYSPQPDQGTTTPPKPHHCPQNQDSSDQDTGEYSPPPAMHHYKPILNKPTKPKPMPEEPSDPYGEAHDDGYGDGYSTDDSCKPKPKPPVKCDTPKPKPPVKCETPTPPPVFGDGDGEYWGDPHLVGFDGEKYDVMGTPNDFYNMISDKNFQYNTQFKDWGNDTTVINKAGITIGKDKLEFDADADAPTLNGTAIALNKKTTLADGKSIALWNGTLFKVDSPEYEVQLSKDSDAKGKFLRSSASLVGDPFADGVKPHGLLGQTADGIAGEKNSGVDRGKQGGTVIDGIVTDYEVKGLFDTAFKSFNRFNVASK